ncbi:hypothetical protein CVO77_07475 [Sphingopyxis lindanitolerans]|uniref:Uncharacterized protein n=1 Tax=Sphingopyxis lindanitolerans TaxID=2054227 RepID=A0A2S8B7E0_9SPHN|nr:hypothetical protein [Sphingopyxis lindanitolerans]PQM28325.1 hypothetical protein CVO77_07475 [Sphingopyxis lindanitolerans]
MKNCDSGRRPSDAGAAFRPFYFGDYGACKHTLATIVMLKQVQVTKEQMRSADSRVFANDMAPLF